MKAYKTSQGVWQISFMENRKRTTIYLGKRHSAASADRIAKVVTDLLAFRNRGEPLAVELLRKVEALPPRIRQSLDRFGIVAGPVEMTLGELCARHRVTKEHLKLRTRQHYDAWYFSLGTYFGEDCPIRDIGVLDAEKFRSECLKVYAAATVSRGVRTCRTIFRYALGKQWLQFNPFEGIVSGTEVNESRQHYVDRETFERLLSACRDDREKLLVALGRYAGLRIPSEAVGLRFRDMRDRLIRVRKDTKTGAREVPMFEEVYDIFRRLDGRPGELVFGNGYRSRQRAWDMLKTLVDRAGLEKWPKLWINMRSSLTTDMTDRGYSEKALDAFFGNSEKVRRVHYEQFRKEKEYEKMMEDNSLIVRYLRENGGVDNVAISENSLRLIFSKLKNLATGFDPEKTNS